MAGSERRPGVRGQYEKWPYPQVPRMAGLRRADTWQLNLDYLWDRCGSGAAPAPGRIWIAGCGTFQPYAFGLANPQAEILATDISTASLARARQRCAWHGQGRVRFAQVDLQDEGSMPAGGFDLIECYGVLMNLADPAAALTAMARRLNPGGVLRLMVYPHYSRQRVFQIQRVAKLLGLRWQEDRHPALLREVMTALPKGHPLRHGFTTYPDTAFDAGIVDAFLHSGDRGFSAGELGALVEGARLQAAAWVHRPHGQPAQMAEALGLDPTQPYAVLDHLDRWQELRSNFVVCLRRPETLIPRPPRLRLHPLLDARSKGLPLGARARILGQQATGVKLRSRVHQQLLRWSAKDLAALRRAAAGQGPVASGLVARGLREGLLLGAEREPAPETRRLELPAVHSPGLRLGPQAPNPLYAHLFAAYEAAGSRLQEELDRWQHEAEPLEEAGGYGLTPYGTWQSRGPELHAILQAGRSDEVGTYASIRYAGEDSGRRRLRSFLRGFDLPRRVFSDAEERELWVLLGTHRAMSLSASRVGS